MQYDTKILSTKWKIVYAKQHSVSLSLVALFPNILLTPNQQHTSNQWRHFLCITVHAWLNNQTNLVSVEPRPSALNMTLPALQWRREGGEGWHAPRAALCRGRHLEGRNVEFWNSAASSELAFALQNGFGWNLHYVITPPTQRTVLWQSAPVTSL